MQTSSWVLKVQLLSRKKNSVNYASRPVLSLVSDIVFADSLHKSRPKTERKKHFKKI